MSQFNEDIGSAWVDLRLNQTPFNRGLRRAEQKMQAVANRMQSIGTAMTVGITVPFTAAGAAAGTFAANFEAEMQKIVSLVGLGQEKVNAMKEEVRAIAEETGRSPAELAKSLFFITSAGLRGSKAIDTLRASAKAAAAGMGDTKAVADAATSAMNAYGKQNLSAAKAVSVMVNTVKEGKLETQELAGTLGQVIPIASDLGVSFEEVGASMAAMTKIGLDARKAATALRGIFRAFIKPSQQAKETLDKYGLSIEELQSRLKSGDIIGVLQELKETIGDNEQAMSNIFPRVRGLIGVLSLVGKNAREARRVSQSLANTTSGELERAFESASTTAQTKFNRSLSRLKNALINLGNAVLPVVIPVIQKLTKWVQWASKEFKNLSDKTKKYIVKIGAGLAALGPALVALGSALSGLASIFSLAISGFSALSNVFTIQGAAIVGILGTIGATISSLWNDRKSIFENLKSIWKGIKNSVASMWKKVRPIWKTMKEIWGNLGKSFDKVGEDFTATFDGLKKLAEKIARGMLALAGAILKVVNAISQIPQEFPGLTKLVSLIVDLIDKIAGASSEVLSFLGKVLGFSAGNIAGGALSLYQGGLEGFDRFAQRRGKKAAQMMGIEMKLDGKTIGQKAMEYQAGTSATISGS